MPAIKRKNGALKEQAASPTKKSRVDRKEASKPKIRSEFTEAETDSDPIVESDTTDHSGSDNGVSWPSEDDEGEGQDTVGGVKLPIRNNETLDDGGPKDSQAKNGFKLGKEL